MCTWLMAVKTISYIRFTWTDKPCLSLIPSSMIVPTSNLRDELVRRIPVYTPEWTDHNASDPGITLIELFSFLGENLLFRFNQIPEAT